MSKKNIKKIIVFIVEGQSDKIALENIITKIMYKFDNVKFEIIRGDITSDDKTTVSNVDNRIYEHIEKVVRTEHLKYSDIEKIIHLMDTDGAYIKNEKVKYNKLYRVKYNVEYIETNDVEGIIKRNNRKREIMDYLAGHDKVKKISYKCYFLSSNLEHALYDIIGEKNNEEKNELATNFALSYIGREFSFIKYLKEDVSHNIPLVYEKAWEFIRQGTESLKRNTNLHLFFIDYFGNV